MLATRDAIVTTMIPIRQEFEITQILNFAERATLYPHHIHPGSIVHFVQHALLALLVFGQKAWLKRHLRICPSAFPLGKRARVDDRDSFHNLSMGGLAKASRFASGD